MSEAPAVRGRSPYCLDRTEQESTEGGADADSRAARVSTAPTDARSRSPVPWLLLGLTLLWALLMARFQAGGVYWALGLYALGVMAVVSLRFRSTFRRLLSPTWLDCGIGLAVGAVMTAATYPAYGLAAEIFPPLRGHVAELYATSRQESVGVALAWVVVILTAEELLWRGAWVEALRRHVAPGAAAAASVLLYAAAQLGSGSWLVGLLAICCGAVWTALCVWRRSLWPPLLAHLIWTPVVIVLHPLS